eukprot:1179721-Prorocentrum_minimum.AAC.2
MTPRDVLTLTLDGATAREAAPDEATLDDCDFLGADESHITSLYLLASTPDKRTKVRSKRSSNERAMWSHDFRD